MYQGDVWDCTRCGHFRPLMLVTELSPPFQAVLWPRPELVQEHAIPVRQAQLGQPNARSQRVVPFAGFDRRQPLCIDDAGDVVDDVLEGWALQASSSDEEQGDQHGDEHVAAAGGCQHGRQPSDNVILLGESFKRLRVAGEFKTLELHCDACGTSRRCSHASMTLEETARRLLRWRECCPLHQQPRIGGSLLCQFAS